MGSIKTDWPPGRAGFSSALTAPRIWRTTLWIWIYCNLLKSHKTAKTFLGKAWQGIALIWKGLQKAWRRRDRAGRTGRALGHDGADRFDCFASSPQATSGHRAPVLPSARSHV